MSNNEIVQKLWNLCDVLRDDGINYADYVTELVLLLFIKMEHENAQSGVMLGHKLPEGARWPDIAKLDGPNLLTYYKATLLGLSQSTDPLISAIYADAQTRMKEPRHLKQLISAIDSIDWYSAQRDGLGDLYEGLLEKNATETKSGAGQYFTPRPLIDSIVALINPQAGETVQDPAAGTAGFLIAADAWIKAKTDNLYDLNEKQRTFQRNKAFIGMELVPGTRRLALMNCCCTAWKATTEGVIHLGDTLGSAGSSPAQKRHHPHQPALRHHQGRRRPDPRRLHLPHQQQAIRLRPAHLPRTSSLAAAPPSCCPTTCCSKPASAPTSGAT